MAQYDFGTIDPNTKSGTALASDLNSWRNALHSTHGGSTAPTYLVAGMLWADTTSANYELKMYDGAQWIQIAVLDATNNVARVAVDSAETSYITSTTAAQIRHVIASTDIFTTRSTGIQFNIASPVIADSNNNELISFTTVASAVNQVDISNAVTGSGPNISAIGGDANIDITLTPKGAGNVVAAGPMAFADGSASTPSITNTGDTNTGLFFPAADTVGFSAGGTERVRIDANGIKFNGDTASANALDDYEEGTWSSAINGVTASVATASGRYTKIGNVVTVNGALVVSGYSGGSGNSSFTLPFAPADTGTPQHGLHITYNNLNTAYTFVAPYNGSATSFIYTAGLFALPGANWTNAEIVFNGSYLAA